MDQDVRPATHKLYKSRFRIFSTYCERYGYSPTECPVEIVTNFLAMLQDTKRVEDDVVISDMHGPPVDISKLDKFYSSRKRIDAPEEKLVLQVPTVQMYFRELLGHGKLDKDSAKKLRKKYFMGDKGYKALAPPMLSNTKLHMIQSHEAGGVFNRFLGIHVSHRDSLKLFLRSYELLGGSGDVFAAFEPVHPYVGDTLAENFELPTLESVSEEVSESAIEQLLPVRSDGTVDMEDLRVLARNNIAMTKLVEKQGSAYLNVIEKLQKATDVAVTGVSVHGTLTDIMVLKYYDCFKFDVFVHF